MAIDKAYYSSPDFYPKDDDMDEVVEEVEIVEEDQPEAIEPEPAAEADSFDADISSLLSESDLQKLASEVVNDFRVDLSSRSDWCDLYIDGLKYLGFEKVVKNEPWENACSVVHPLMSEAVVRFQSNAIMELFPADGPVKVKVVGQENEEIIKQGDRVKGYMNYLLTEAIEDYRDEAEKLLFSLPQVGSAFKKVRIDSRNGMPCAEFVPAEDIVVNYGAKNLRTANRITHIIRCTKHDLEVDMATGFYPMTELGDPVMYYSDISEKKDKINGVESQGVADDLYTLLEQHCYLNIEDEGISKPYIVTIIHGTDKILSIKRNWKEGDPNLTKINHFVHYQYVPGTGFYGYGLTHLVGGITQSTTSILRQLVDAGTLSNVPGGWKVKGFNVDSDSPIAPGEWRDIDVSGADIRNMLYPLQYKEPSTVLLNLLTGLVEEGRRFASLNDIQAADMNNQAPVGTTLAILERTMKVMSAIHSRMHNSARQEFKMMAELISKYGPDSYPYDLGQYTTALRSDFDGRIDILPVSDPNASTMAQRIMVSQAAMELSKQKPELYNHKELHRNFLSVMNMHNIDVIIPPDEELKNQDPVTENVMIIMGRPVKAFEWQDHQAHIEVHMAAIKDPKITGLLSQSPSANSMMAAMSDHIQTHVAYAYKSKIEKELGFRMPSIDDNLSETAEVEFSRVVSQAAQRLLASNVAEEKMRKNQAILEDPNFQLAKRELDIKEADLAARAQDNKDRTQLEALRAMASYSDQEKDRIIDVVKMLLDAEAKSVDIMNKKNMGDVNNIIKWLQTIVGAATESDKMTMQRRSNNG